METLIVTGTPPTELLLDWRQSADEVIVKLRVGAGPLRLEEVDAAFTDTDCVVRLPGVSICPEPSTVFEASGIPHPSSLPATPHSVSRWSAVGWCFLCRDRKFLHQSTSP